MYWFLGWGFVPTESSDWHVWFLKPLFNQAHVEQRGKYDGYLAEGGGCFFTNLDIQEGCFLQFVKLDSCRGEVCRVTSSPPALICLFVLFPLGSASSSFLCALSCSSELRRVFLTKSPRRDRLIAQTCNKDGLRRSVQPQAVGVPVAEGHRQRDVHRLYPG